jgi:hypothetical protein
VGLGQAVVIGASACRATVTEAMCSDGYVLLRLCYCRLGVQELFRVAGDCRIVEKGKAGT